MAKFEIDIENHREAIEHGDDSLHHLQNSIKFIIKNVLCPLSYREKKKLINVLQVNEEVK